MFVWVVDKNYYLISNLLCMCVCVCACACACVHACMCACVCMCVCVCSYITGFILLYKSLWSMHLQSIVMLYHGGEMEWERRGAGSPLFYSGVRRWCGIGGLMGGGQHNTLTLKTLKNPPNLGSVLRVWPLTRDRGLQHPASSFACALKDWGLRPPFFIF